MSDGDPSTNAYVPEPPAYPEEWQDHRFCVFLKVGICTKSGDVDFLLNDRGYRQLCDADKRDFARTLGSLADRVVNDLKDAAEKEPA